MKKVIYQVIYHILKPLVAILHRKAVSFDEFSQIAKKLFVAVAEKQLREAGERPTNSRISVSTGLTRREVAQLRQTSSESLLASTRINRGLRVINGWMTDAEFSAEAGLPVQGDKGSFEALVNRYSGDIPYRAMLKELCASGVVMLDDAGDRLSLLDNAYIPQQSDEERLVLMGQDVSLLLQTIDHNHQHERGEAYYQRKVSYDNLSLEAVLVFRQMAREESHALLLKFNQWLAQHDRDSNPDMQGKGKNRYRAGVGIYYFEEPLPAQNKAEGPEEKG
ncbi:MAG: hypothetical protein KDI44_04070 [Thiothrix sp.]|nr:hypothetical protein [Thiothrix sp.]